MAVLLSSTLTNKNNCLETLKFAVLEDLPQVSTAVVISVTYKLQPRWYDSRDSNVHALRRFWAL